MRTFPPALIAFAILPVASGCVAVVAGAAAAAGYVMYEENEAYRDFDAPLGDTWKATLAGLGELGHDVDGDFPHGPTEGTIDLEQDDVHVKVEQHPEGFTRVRVRIGTFHTKDHRRRAELLLAEVAERVPALETEEDEAGE